MLNEVNKAAQILENENNLSVGIVNMPWLNIVDRKWLLSVVQGINMVIVVDDHYLNGGLFSMISAEVAGSPELSVSIKTISITEIPECGLNHEVLKYHQLDSHSISNYILNQINEC